MTATQQPELGRIAEAIRRRLATIPGLATYAEEPATPRPPAAWPFGPVAADYELEFTATRTSYRYEVVVIVPTSAQLSAMQAQLQPYLARRGLRSVPGALLADSSLGGLVAALWVRGLRHVGQIVIGDVAYYGGLIEVEVQT